MSITIIKAGLHDAIQDEGRYGYRHLGINTGGAMDRNAMHLANILAGNELHLPVLEMHFPAATILFNTGILMAITGADFSPELNGDSIPMWQPVLVEKGSVLHFKKKLTGARTYLAFAGGFNVQCWLGSYSTNLLAEMGGYEGRLLKKGDEIYFERTGFNLHKTDAGYEVFHWHINKPYYDNRLGILPGRHWQILPGTEQHLLLNNAYYITGRANRMGYQLTGPVIQTTIGEQVSSAVNFGTIQLLPGGQLIVLGADHQATGGYPVIGHVIAAHHHKLAQLSAGESIVFEMVRYDDALSLLQEQRKNLLQIQNAVNLKFERFF